MQHDSPAWINIAKKKQIVLVFKNFNVKVSTVNLILKLLKITKLVIENAWAVQRNKDEACANRWNKMPDQNILHLDFITLIHLYQINYMFIFGLDPDYKLTHV